MSTETLTGLRDYLYSTLSPTNMIWLGTQLAEYGRQREKHTSVPYTIEEIHQMVAEGEQQFADGQWQDSEDMFRELEEEFEREDELDLAMAV